MIVLTNCLAEKTDEGCLKVANSLIKRIKEVHPETTIISYDNRSEQSDCHLRLNKLFLNRRLFGTLNSKRDKVLYIPFSSNTKASVVRTCILAAFCRSRIDVLFVLQHPMSGVLKKLLKLSGVRVITISQSACTFFRNEIGCETMYLKTGVDTQKFRPVNQEEKTAIRKKYSIGESEKVVLHVGHLKEGRNIGQLLKIGEEYRVILVASTLTKHEQDDRLRAALEERHNIRIIDTYVERIQELYQLADVYFFPVQEQENCIDAPLSVLEAAACNLPVVVTPYGELKELLGKDGFNEITSFEQKALNGLLQRACEEKSETRNHVLEYDWSYAVRALMI